LAKEFKVISLRASAKKIAEENSKIIERLRQLFAEAKIVEFRGLQTSCSQAVDKLCSHYLFPVVVTRLEQAVLITTCNKLGGIIRLVTRLF
jgi:hypothetical protein